MPSQLTRHLNGNLELTLTVPWARIQKAYEAAVTEAVAATRLPGFRQGKAPRQLVAPKLDQDQLYNQALRRLFPDLYAAAVKAHNLKPLLYPTVKIKLGQAGQDWILLATTCEAPRVTLPDYKKDLAQLKAPDKQKLTAILDYLTRQAQVEVPDLVVEEEVNHRLARLVENISTLGLTVEQYLASKRLTPQALRQQHRQQARSDLAREFILEEIRQAENLADRKLTLDFLVALV